MDSDFVGNYLNSGIHHVITGWDHLLFASALVLALTGFWEVFKIIGIFTVAHSLSVVATALHGSELMPSWFVEPVIGGSIVFVALENILRRKISLNPQRILVVFLLGLVHGMGFGGALLKDLQGIEGNAAAWAIAAFCIGVEAGHLCVVAPLSGALKVGRDAAGEKFSQAVLQWGSALIALGGCYYFITAVRAAMGSAGE